MVENQKYHTNKSIYSDTIDAFEGYCWPGNVRELENLLENLVITTPGDIIRRENLPLKLRRPQQVSAEEEEETVSLKSVVERAEYAAIERAIEKYGSIRKAAAALVSIRPLLPGKCSFIRTCLPENKISKWFEREMTGRGKPFSVISYAK